jgi:hypothetical protein
MYYSSCCQNSVENYHKESEQFILQLTNLAAPPDTKHTDFSQQNALLQNPNNKNNNKFFFFFFPKETKYGVPTRTPASPSKTKKKPLKNTKNKAKTNTQMEERENQLELSAHQAS